MQVTMSSPVETFADRAPEFTRPEQRRVCVVSESGDDPTAPASKTATHWRVLAVGAVAACVVAVVGPSLARQPQLTELPPASIPIRKQHAEPPTVLTAIEAHDWFRIDRARETPATRGPVSEERSAPTSAEPRSSAQRVISRDAIPPLENPYDTGTLPAASGQSEWSARNL
jgi:hypothetical protein